MASKRSVVRGSGNSVSGELRKGFQIEGLKELQDKLATCINAVAAVFFVFAGLVSWPDALVMAVGAIVGGVGGANMARRVGPGAVRRIVVVVGFAMALSLMLRL